MAIETDHECIYRVYRLVKLIISAGQPSCDNSNVITYIFLHLSSLIAITYHPLYSPPTPNHLPVHNNLSWDNNTNSSFPGWAMVSTPHSESYSMGMPLSLQKLYYIDITSSSLWLVSRMGHGLSHRVGTLWDKRVPTLWVGQMRYPWNQRFSLADQLLCEVQNANCQELKCIFWHNTFTLYSWSWLVRTEFKQQCLASDKVCPDMPL